MTPTKEGLSSQEGMMVNKGLFATKKDKATYLAESKKAGSTWDRIKLGSKMFLKEIDDTWQQLQYDYEDKKYNWAKKYRVYK